MQLILNIPMLTNHRDEVTGRSDEARNVDPVVTGNGRTWRSGTNRFDDNHRLEVRPLRQRRKNRSVRYGPDSSPYCAAVRIVEGIKAIIRIAPWKIVFDILMKVLFDHGGGLFMIALQGQ